MALETKNDDNRTVLRVVINFDLGLMNKFIKRSLNFISELHPYISSGKIPPIRAR